MLTTCRRTHMRADIIQLHVTSAKNLFLKLHALARCETITSSNFSTQFISFVKTVVRKKKKKRIVMERVRITKTKKKQTIIITYN